MKNTGLTDNPNYVAGSYPDDNPVYGALASFILTLINIGCIFFSAALMFEVKEVRGVNTFWKEDVKNVRKYNKAMRADSGIASIYEKAYKSAVMKKSHGSSRAFLSPIEKIKISWRRKTSASSTKARAE